MRCRISVDTEQQALSVAVAGWTALQAPSTAKVIAASQQKPGYCVHVLY